MPVKNKLLGFSFMMLTVIAAWNLQLNSIALKVAEVLGFKSDSFGEAVTTGILVPVSISLIATIAQLVYGRWVWRLVPQSQYSAGVWIYALIAQVEKTELPVAGWFILKHNSSEARIDEAKAYYLDQDGLVFRGEWTSDAIWVKNNELGLVFHMRALGIEREPIPSQYHGFIQLRLEATIRLPQQSVWVGHFHDLGERTGIHGPIAAKRLKVRTAGHRKPEDLIAEHVEGLMSSVLQRMGRTKTTYKNRSDNGS